MTTSPPYREDVLQARVKWVAFLQRSETLKGIAYLDDGAGRRDCIGHGCHALGIESVVSDDGHVLYGEEQHAAIAPARFIEVTGLRGPRGELADRSGDLIEMNDKRGMSPQQLGAWIEGRPSSSAHGLKVAQLATSPTALFTPYPTTPRGKRRTPMRSHGDISTDPAVYPWQLLITGGEDAPGQASTLTLEQARKLLKDRESSAFAAGATGECRRIHDMIHNEILPNWDTNGVEGKPGVQWLSQADWVEVANFMLGVGDPAMKPQVETPGRARWEVKDAGNAWEISNPSTADIFYMIGREDSERLCTRLNLADRNSHAYSLLGLIIASIPLKRDWLDPDLERMARALLGKENSNA